MQARKNEEIALVQQAQQGNLDAFTELFNRWNRPLLQYLYHMLGNNQEAEDMAQDSFLRAYENIKRLGPPWDFKSWLYQIASNLTINYLKRQRRFINADDPDEPIEPEMPSSPRSPEQQVESQERQRQVWKALGTLPTLYRQALVLREINELSYDEIRVALDCSYENARQLVHRARLRFREEYGFAAVAAAGVPRCRVLGDLLSAYHDGQLDADERRRVEEHMRTCEDCRETQKDMKMIGALLLGLPPFIPHAEWASKVLREIGGGGSPSDGNGGRTAPRPEAVDSPSAGGPVPDGRGGGGGSWPIAAGLGMFGLILLGLFFWMRFGPPFALPTEMPNPTASATADLMSITADSSYVSPTPNGGGILEIITSTPAVTPSATASATPGMIPFLLDKNANCRHGPGTVYPVLTSVLLGQQVQLIGRNDEGSWYFGIIPGGFRCWIAASSGTPDGDPNGLPILKAPPTPTPTLTPRPNINGGNQIDNDGDGYPFGQDCNDKDPAIHPGAPETKYDGVDSNCNGDDNK